MRAPEVLAPSKSYLERKCGEAESYWTKDFLSAVHNCAQADGNGKATMDFEQRSGTFLLGQKVSVVPLPAGSEAFRNGSKVMAMCYGYTSMRCPQNSRLASWPIQLFQDYVDCLLGPKLWGFVFASKGKVTSSPALDASWSSSKPSETWQLLRLIPAWIF